MRCMIDGNHHKKTRRGGFDFIDIQLLRSGLNQCRFKCSALLKVSHP